jgi:hypothetical protein
MMKSALAVFLYLTLSALYLPANADGALVFYCAVKDRTTVIGGKSIDPIIHYGRLTVMVDDRVVIIDEHKARTNFQLMAPRHQTPPWRKEGDSFSIAGKRGGFEHAGYEEAFTLSGADFEAGFVFMHTKLFQSSGKLFATWGTCSEF